MTWNPSSGCLAHADLFEIEGLVATTGWSSGGDNADWIMTDSRRRSTPTKRTCPTCESVPDQEGHLADESRQEIGYWPSPDYLRSVTVVGSQKRGMSFIGKDNNSPGSDLIIKAGRRKG